MITLTTNKINQQMIKNASRCNDSQQTCLTSQGFTPNSLISITSPVFPQRKGFALQSVRIVKYSRSSTNRTLLIHKIPSRCWISSLLPLPLTVRTIPLFWQVFLLNAASVEPLSFAVWIFTGHHLSKRSTSAITILRLLVVVEEVLLLEWVGLSGVHLHLFALHQLLLSLFFVFVLELTSKHSLVLQHFGIQLIRDIFFLLGIPMHFLLLLENEIVVEFHLGRHFVDLPFLKFLDLQQKLVLHGSEHSFDILDPLVQFPNESEEAIDIIGDGDHLVHKVIEVSVRHDNIK